MEENKVMEPMETNDGFEEEESGLGVKALAIGLAIAGGITAIGVAGYKKVKGKLSKNEDPPKRGRKLKFVEVDENGNVIFDSEAKELDEEFDEN